MFYDVILNNGHYVSACHYDKLPTQVRACLPLTWRFRLPVLGLFMRGYWLKNKGACLDGPLRVRMPWRRSTTCAS